MTYDEYYESEQYASEKMMEMTSFAYAYCNGRFPAGTLVKLSENQTVAYGKNGSVILRSHHVIPVKDEDYRKTGYQGESFYQGFRDDGNYFCGYISHDLIRGDQEHFVNGVFIYTDGKVEHLLTDYSDTYDRHDPITFAYDVAAESTDKFVDLSKEQKEEPQEVVDDGKAFGDDE